MDILQFIFLIAFSILCALMEIQIEGENGWAKDLPTWKIKNPFMKIIGWPTIDGYHLSFWGIMILVFHAPFFFGFPFTRENELLVIEMIIIFSILEDFLWFAFNPKWGLKRFFKEEIPWHPNKFLFFPQNYWISFLLVVIFKVIKNSFI